VPLITFQLPEHTGVFLIETTLCFLHLHHQQWQRNCVFLRWDHNGSHFMDDCEISYDDKIAKSMQILWRSICRMKYETVRKGWLFFRLISITIESQHLGSSMVVIQLAKKLPAFYGTRRFIAVLTRPRKISPPWAKRIQSMSSYPIILWSMLILSFYSCPGLSSSLFPWTKILYALLTSPTRATCPVHLIQLHLITNTIWSRVQL
jgi:hypothetical protein